MSLVHGTYDRHRYQVEMQTAFDNLADLVERIVNPTDNVLPFEPKTVLVEKG
jgi:hypothetical protein